MSEEWEENEPDMDMPPEAVAYNKGWDEGSKQARAEVFGASKRLYEAARWVLHVVNGVGKAGGEPEKGEDDAAFEELQAAMESVQPAAADLEALLREKELESLYWCRRNLDTYDHGEGIPYAAVELRHKVDVRIAELEKARAEGKG